MKTFSEFLEEAKKPKSDYLNTITQKMKRKGINVQASHTSSGGIRIHGFHVPSEKQNRGIGSWGMRNLQNVARRNGTEIRLSASSEPGRERDLHRFYRRHGFQRPDRFSDTYVWKS